MPLGPQLQLKMYSHAVEQIEAGRERVSRHIPVLKGKGKEIKQSLRVSNPPQDVLNAMFPTPLGADGSTNHTGARMAGHHTFFATRSVLSINSIATEVRTDGRDNAIETLCASAKQPVDRSDAMHCRSATRHSCL